VRGSEKGDLADAGVVLLEQTNQLRVSLVLYSQGSRVALMWYRVS
jgi:hypothetical protein